MRRLPPFLLIASLAVFALPSFGTAQAPRGRSSPALLAPLQLANRALLEGKYDEIDALTVVKVLAALQDSLDGSRREAGAAAG